MKPSRTCLRRAIATCGHARPLSRIKGYALAQAWPASGNPRAMLLTLIAVLSLVLAACGDDDTSAQPPGAATSSSTSHTPETQGEALKIGVLAELSGGAARWGASIQIGVDLAIKHVNATGGVNGRDVVLVTADTGGSPIRAAAEARRLVDIEGVHAIVGPLSPGSTLDAAERLATSARIPLVTPAMMQSPRPSYLARIHRRRAHEQLRLGAPL